MFNKKLVSDVKDVKDSFIKLYGEITKYQLERYEKLINKFKNDYNENKGYMASSSGRVELIGNHTDHNGGVAIATAISLDTVAMFLPTDNNIITIKSFEYGDIIVDLNKNVTYEPASSSALVKGISEYFKEKGYKVGGFIASTTSNVSGGAGVSSSASFEILICEIFNFLYNNCKIDEKTKAIVSQKAENTYFGKPCGLLDQSAIAFGGITLLDFKNCGDVEATKIDSKLEKYTLVLIETGGNHKNLTSEYASITDEIKEVCKFFGVKRLIELDKNVFYDKLPELYKVVNGRAIMRAIHFYNENERVYKVSDALTTNNFSAFLEAIKESGISSETRLQNCYVPGDKIQLIPTALAISSNYLYGGVNRVHGGGFAGTILNILENDKVDYFVEKMSKIYGNEKVIPLKVREVGAIIL